MIILPLLLIVVLLTFILVIRQSLLEEDELFYFGESQFKSISYLTTFWKNSFDFKGKTSRKVFWHIQAWLLLILFFLILIGYLIFLDFSEVGKYLVWSDAFQYSELRPYVLIPINVFSILSLIPSISLQVRRLRDAAKNPWWILISFIPFFGGIVLLIFYISPSRKKKLPMTLQDRLNEVEDLLDQGTIDEEEYKFMRKKILTKYMD